MIPEGYTSVTPYLCCKDAARALDFYKAAFGATELMRMPAPGGKVGHAEILIGNARVMLADEFPEMNFRSPQSYGGTPVMLYVYVDDCDAVFAKALAEGAKMRRELKDEFYGDRTGQIEDPFGHLWNISTHKEDVPPEEMERRMKAMNS